MKRVLGIFRGFPGLGRVVAGVSLLESLRDDYNCDIQVVTYLQGNEYLKSRGYNNIHEAIPMDYCSIGLLPTNQMGVHIHSTIKVFNPDIVIIDGEPLILQSLRISYPELKIVALLNPSDVDNPENDKEAMDYFNALYSLSDLAIIHGLRKVVPLYKYRRYLSIDTIIRKEILALNNIKSNNIYCVLGGGTVNVGHQFAESSIKIGELCQEAAKSLKDYTMHIVCSSQNIYDALNENGKYENVILHKNVLDAKTYYSNACLIITRSGRNSLSELAYLGIPTISFVSGCKYRRNEQEQNIKSLNFQNIATEDLTCKSKDFLTLCTEMINKGKCENSFNFGNNIAINNIIDLIHD